MSFFNVDDRRIGGFMLKKPQSISNVLSCNTTGGASILSATFPVGAVITTASGNVVPYQIATSAASTYTDEDIITELNGLNMCELVERQKVNYNCHAYAYLSLDPKNRDYRKRVTLTDREPFTNDSKYKRYTTPRLGAVAEYSMHSGVVVKVVGEYAGEPIIESVWLQYNCVVSHPISQYGSGDIVTSYFK